MVIQIEQGILNGVRVLDFTWVLAGPYATRLLGDFGAEVIKVQSKRTAKGAESNNTGYFNTWNRNKRSITLDMSHAEAKKIALNLVKISDVVIENYSPRVMSNWGLDYEKLKEVKSDLIMLSISAMGQTGPWRDFVAFGPTLQAFSGLTYLTSYTQNSLPGVGYAYADFIAGLYAGFAVLAALEYRDRTGQSQYIDLSGYEAICTLIGPALSDLSLNQKDILPKGNRSDHIPAAPYGCYPCSGNDRWCVIALFKEEEWQSFCQVLGYPAWTKEERFSDLLRRKEHEEELDELIGQWTAQHPPEEIVQLLQKAGVPSGLVQNAEDLAKDPHLLARDFFTKLEHPLLGSTFLDRSPIRFKDSPKTYRKAAPLLGEDNQYVYMELLGFPEEEFSSYVKRGIIG